VAFLFCPRYHGKISIKEPVMATAIKLSSTRLLPPLENGDCLDQKTFHARYEAMPEGRRAELIGGIVYMPSPQKVPHSKALHVVSHWLGAYVLATPGTDTLMTNTQILGPDSEPEPDACLFIDPECGGRVWVDKDEYLHGPPELIVEVSSATESIDLHRKKDDYEKAGVREYVVLALRMQRVFWFVRRRAKYKEVPLPANGVFRSREFAGLWLDANAVLRNHRQRVLAALKKGLATHEHAAFVAKLQKRASKP
jgi:Uma2 family endonuclease